MRDLGGQNFSVNKRTSPRNFSRTLFFLAILAGVVFFGYRFLSKVDIVGGSSITLGNAPHDLKPVQAIVSNIDENAVNLKTNQANFTNVSGENASATASRKYGDGSYVLSVVANLPKLEGDKYQVFVVGDTIKLAGTMEGSGSSYSLIFRDTDKYSNYEEIWITREITSNDEIPEKHILEGRF